MTPKSVVDEPFICNWGGSTFYEEEKEREEEREICAGCEDIVLRRQACHVLIG